MKGRGGGPSRRQAARPLPYDRKKFLQANFRFLVGDAGNLHSCEKDPDLAPDWEDVVEVIRKPDRVQLRRLSKGSDVAFKRCFRIHQTMVELSGFLQTSVCEVYGYTGLLSA